MWKTRVFYGVYGAANLGLVLYGLLALINPQILTDSFSAHVFQFPPDASTALVYLAALYRLLGFFNMLVGILGLWLLWRHHLDPQSWLARTEMIISLLAYLAPVIFDNTVGHIGFFEILEQIFLAAMLAVWIVIGQIAHCPGYLTHPSDIFGIFEANFVRSRSCR